MDRARVWGYVFVKSALNVQEKLQEADAATLGATSRLHCLKKNILSVDGTETPHNNIMISDVTQQTGLSHKARQCDTAGEVAAIHRPRNETGQILHVRHNFV